ncbi:hypothetical protein FOA52_010714 [Chlamydomonas sp. UWO 241]|nr:hypothetical protein FOA52_010714 [Chlamydomonas sp. UWO 241]
MQKEANDKDAGKAKTAAKKGKKSKKGKGVATSAAVEAPAGGEGAHGAEASTSAPMVAAAAALADEESLCVVCFEEERCVTLMPCEHRVLCRGCAVNVRAKNDECPMCRAPIKYAVPCGSMAHNQPCSSSFSVTIKHWHGVAEWTWCEGDDDICGICRTAYDGCAPDVKYPGDDSPVVWGACAHAFHLQCIQKWLASSTEQRCPMCRRTWSYKAAGEEDSEEEGGNGEEGSPGAQSGAPGDDNSRLDEDQGEDLGEEEDVHGDGDSGDDGNSERQRSLDMEEGPGGGGADTPTGGGARDVPGGSHGRGYDHAYEYELNRFMLHHAESPLDELGHSGGWGGGAGPGRRDDRGAGRGGELEHAELGAAGGDGRPEGGRRLWAEAGPSSGDSPRPAAGAAAARWADRGGGQSGAGRGAWPRGGGGGFASPAMSSGSSDGGAGGLAGARTGVRRFDLGSDDGGDADQEEGGRMGAADGGVPAGAVRRFDLGSDDGGDAGQDEGGGEGGRGGRRPRDLSLEF